jgi:putative oxidoreductase
MTLLKTYESEQSGSVRGRRIDAGLLLLRVSFGLALALAHGLGKLPPSDRFVSGVAEMGFPMPALFAWASALAEFAGGILLAVGLLTRPAALVVCFNMAVASFVRQSGQSFGDRELALAYMIAAAAILLCGSGRFSVDHWIHTRRSRT